MAEHQSGTKPAVLVVGAGVIGSSLAAELARGGHPVTVVDSGGPGTGTTAASYAWVNANSKSPAGYAELNLLGLRAHERWSAGRTRGWFHQPGQLQIVHSERRMSEVEEQVARYRESGYPVRLLTAGQVADLEPGLDPDRVTGGALFPDEGWADTDLMCSALVDEAIAHGARLLAYHRVVEANGDGVVVSGPDGTVHWLTPDITVLAAGNGIRPLAQDLGVDFPTLPTAASSPTALADDAGPAVERRTVGMVCTTEPARGLPRHLVHTDRVSLRPAANGGVMLTDHPTASSWSAEGAGLWQAPQELLDRARALCPALDHAEIATVTVGHRVLPSDGLTIADWLDPEHRFYAVATHSGVTLAPHLAEAVAQEIGTGARHASLADFGLKRFSVS